MWNTPSKRYTSEFPDGRRVCVASEWQLRSNPSSAVRPCPLPSPPSPHAKASSTSSPKMSAPMPSPMHAPQQALLPPSLEEAALKLEAGLRNALRLEEELDEWAVAALATSQKPVEVHQATDLQAWQEEALQLRRGGLLLLSIWEKRSLTELTNHAVLLMAVLLLWLLLGVSGSGEQPAPAPGPYWNVSTHHHLLGSEFCLWRWKAFRCSAGCKPHMHWPGLQGVCAPI